MHTVHDCAPCVVVYVVDVSEKADGSAVPVSRSAEILRQFLNDVGLNYLTINRTSNTLSGGESQRINLATSLGSSLVGSMYILDEPSIGLHPKDTERLIGVLKDLRDLGNTVIVVEHDTGGPQIAACIDRFSIAHLFWAHVGRCSTDDLPSRSAEPSQGPASRGKLSPDEQ